ncbi:hypothetical protein HK104_005778 [Borealophlyctis nickersoniae]|nr:hypothetical protein HK104_005778 [Borealophlyctis nickersoniae]
MGSGTCIANTTRIASVGAMGPPTTFNFSLTPSTQTFTPGQNAGSNSINVTLDVPQGATGGSSGKEFHGILLYAAETVDGTVHYGSWRVPGTASPSGGPGNQARYRLMDGNQIPVVPDCGSFGVGSTLTHASPVAKGLPVTFEWVPPTSASGTDGKEIKFFAAVVADLPQDGGDAFEVVESVGVKAAGNNPMGRRRAVRRG